MKKICSKGTIVLRIALTLLFLVPTVVIGDIVFNDGLFFKNAASSNLFGVRNSDDQYMSINLDRTRYLESIVITNAYMIQKAAEEYAYMNSGNYPYSFCDLTLPPSLINPFDFSYPVYDGSSPIEGAVGYCHSYYSPSTYTIVGAGKNGRIIITLHSSYNSN
ncbi:hypothetical protein JW890_07785 [candidate division WOR-3 bacterium]|nr:hypothetical protein [candidate division WOR-3 bacterium]